MKKLMISIVSLAFLISSVAVFAGPKDPNCPTEVGVHRNAVPDKQAKDAKKVDKKEDPSAQKVK